MVTAPGSALVLPLMDLLYRASLSNTPACADLHQRLTHPTVGDPVIVLDARHAWVRDHTADAVWRGVGYLVARRAEWWTSDEEWERAIRDGEVFEDEPRMVERDACYVQYGPDPADVCRWVNCDVAAVPVDGRRSE
jgi:hypothetical protein